MYGISVNVTSSYPALHGSNSLISINGFETYSYSGNSDLQKLIHKNILNRIPSLKDRGIKKASYYVLKYTKANAVLIECGFITNESDYKILLNNIHFYSVYKIFTFSQVIYTLIETSHN